MLLCVFARYLPLLWCFPSLPAAPACSQLELCDTAAVVEGVAKAAATVCKIKHDGGSSCQSSMYVVMFITAISWQVHIRAVRDAPGLAVAGTVQVANG
jgi:hypothetical protein